MITAKSLSPLHMKTLRAIDLYSGVGGWTLGLSMASIEVVRSYEWSPVANATHDANFGTSNENCDIRQLALSDLPRGIDLVVGSPPCTQFSFANRGGSGDLQDGLIDIRKFLEIVRYLSPKFWAMENVPRVADILRRELAPGGMLNEFCSLFSVIDVFDMSLYGLPQRRIRTIAGHFPVDYLYSFQGELGRRTLGDVVRALAGPTAKDPVYGHTVPAAQVSDHVVELPLSAEEVRMNRDAKTFHPVYNRMSFPERMDDTARTVTATCTRVSRESMVLPNRGEDSYRRLTIREKASLQGFPIEFVFSGDRYAERVKQVGNAIPPLFTYLIAQSMQQRALGEFAFPPNPRRVLGRTQSWPSAKPDGPSRRFRDDRRFAAAVVGLRFGSGMRFELANRFEESHVVWTVAFYFGTSKEVHRGALDEKALERILRSKELLPFRDVFVATLTLLEQQVGRLDPKDLQDAWKRSAAGIGPYEIVDILASNASSLISAMGKAAHLPSVIWIRKWLNLGSATRSMSKLERNAPAILVGALIGSWFNARSRLSSRVPSEEQVERKSPVGRDR